MRNFYLNKSLQSKVILVVEDDDISFLVLSEYLEQNNYKVLRAVNGKEAISLIKNNKEAFNLVLMDILMPVMNGFEAAKEIRKINKNIPIIAETAIAYDWNNDNDFSNFNRVIMKPIDFKELQKQLDLLINKNNISNLLEFQTN